MSDILKEDGSFVCDVCGEVTKRTVLFGEKTYTINCMCKCKEAEKAKQEAEWKKDREMIEISRLRTASLMDKKFRNITYKTYNVTSENRKVATIAKNYIEKFDTMYERNQGMIFYGNPGGGKSYTAALIANELMNKRVPVIITSFVKLLEGNMVDEIFLKNMNKAKLLIIDDLGAERKTDYALEQVYDIIDSRYRAGKPIIFTTNLTIKEMKDCPDERYQRIYDRIFEMCYPVQFAIKSWRKKEAENRFAETKLLLEG